MGNMKYVFRVLVGNLVYMGGKYQNGCSINLLHCRLDLVGIEHGPVAGCCECGNAACGFMKN
jgi:hypothetical protein